jgi:fatty acid desaturase
VREYRALSWWGRLKYRLYRHPLIMFGVGPAYLFLLQHRVPVGLMRNGWLPWASTMATNLAITLVVASFREIDASPQGGIRSNRAPEQSGGCTVPPFRP